MYNGYLHRLKRIKDGSHKKAKLGEGKESNEADWQLFREARNTYFSAVKNADDYESNDFQKLAEGDSTSYFWSLINKSLNVIIILKQFLH